MTKDEQIIKDALIEYAALADIKDAKIDKENADIAHAAFTRLCKARGEAVKLADTYLTAPPGLEGADYLVGIKTIRDLLTGDKHPTPAEAVTPRYHHNGTEVRDIWTRLIATCYNEKDAKHIANCLNGATAEAPQGQAVNDGLVSALKAIIIEKDKFIRNENDSGGTISAMALISEYALTTASNTKPEVIVVNEGMKEALKECSSDLEAEILARAPGELPRRIERDMETVLRAKAALQASDLPRGGNLPSAREIREQALQELYEKIDLKRDRIRDEDGETDTVIGMGYCLDMIIQMRRALKDGGA